MSYLQESYPKGSYGKRGKLLSNTAKGLVQKKETVELLPGSGFSDQAGIKNLKLGAAFQIKNVVARQYRFIQTLILSPRPDRVMGTIITIKDENGHPKKLDVFVDGGINSPSVKNKGDEVGEPGRPYYCNTKCRTDLIAQGYSFDSQNNNGKPAIIDIPLSIKHFDSATFRTHLVAVDYYKKEKKDKLLGYFDWSFYLIDGKPEPSHSKINFRERNKFSPMHQRIIKLDYPNYKF